jgi:acetyltransferase-like isoleucine patch superfamily enzyme
MSLKEAKKETVVIQKELFNENKSRLRKYQDLIIGKSGIFSLILYEIVLLISSWVPGALGLFLRSKLYPLLLGKVGKNVNFGLNVVFRHPHKISIGDNVVVDDNCVLDAKGTDNKGIVIGNGVFIGRNTILYCKNGDIELDDNVNIGFNSQIFSASSVKLGKNVLIAAYCYLIGGGHDFTQTDIPVLNQGRSSKGILIKDNVWLGAGVKVLDGVVIERDSIVGTGAVVIKDVPPFMIVAGVPAKPIKSRSGISNDV